MADISRIVKNLFRSATKADPTNKSNEAVSPLAQRKGEKHLKVSPIRKILIYPPQMKTKEIKTKAQALVWWPKSAVYRQKNHPLSGVPLSADMHSQCGGDYRES